MITKLTVRNFKSIGEQTYDFTKFDLLVGRNNCGKSTILQALAIWQFCIEEFHRSNRTGTKGIQVILPNFTALPVPEFNLLWKDRTDRKWPFVGDKKKQEYILIDIVVEWHGTDGNQHSFEVQLRYQSPQAIYAIPSEGWSKFRELEEGGLLPVVAYVPPFSGLDPTEEWRDDGPIRKQIGKAQPGSVLRNLLYRVCPPPQRDTSGKKPKGYKYPKEWEEVQEIVKRWFSVNLKPPKYEKGIDTQIICEYIQNNEPFDIISGGSGFHQTLTLLAFLYGYKPTTILLDEPDAHLHVNLQREILDYFKRKSTEKNVQFLIATHAEEFARGVDASQIMSLLSHVPKRVEATPEILRAMADVSNMELAQLWDSPIILYVEGESDERILRAWAKPCDAEEAISKVCFRVMGGGTKQQMKENADNHFNALQQIIPGVQRIVLFDYDDRATYHPEPGNPVLFEWGRKNIENYLLVSDAWERTAFHELLIDSESLFANPVRTLINDFFSGENLTLPRGKEWHTLSAQVFKDVDGKKLLFEDDSSLFQKLRANDPPAELIREVIAVNMITNEIHADVFSFFEKLKNAVNHLSS
jgi:hypothetical protein